MILSISKEQINGSYCYVKCHNAKFKVLDLEIIKLVDYCNYKEEAIALRDSRVVIDKF